VEAADGWGLGEALVVALRRATLLSRGPKSRGAVRAAGLIDAWSPPSESSAEVLEHLLASDLEGVRVAVQLHGEPLPDFVDALNCAGAQVIQVPVYRWVLPADLAPLDRLLGVVLDGSIDAVSFTSAPAAASVLSRADDRCAGAHVVGGSAGPGAALAGRGSCAGVARARRGGRRGAAGRATHPDGPAAPAGDPSWPGGAAC
jgi:uroporphyrinogen-III synthase